MKQKVELNAVAACLHSKALRGIAILKGRVELCQKILLHFAVV